MGYGHLDNYLNRESRPRVKHFQRPLDFPEIIVLCGSTRFIKLFDEMSLNFTLEGKIVLSVGSHHISDHGSFFEDKKEMLDELHKRKIDMSDIVFVINKDQYIGESTRSEIEYAKLKGKTIQYLEEVIS